jgi:hypothetical protein
MDRRLVVLKCHIFGAVASTPPLAVSALIRDVRISVREAVLPFGRQRDVFHTARLWYDGELVVKAQALNWARVEAALPPPGVAGRVSAVRLAAPGLRPYLENPQLSVLARELWLERLARTSVRVEPGDKIVAGLYARDIISFIPRDEMICHHGSRLASGLFSGSPRASWGPWATTPAATAPQRLSINAVPSNALQVPIQGDIKALPLFSQWLRRRTAHGRRGQRHLADHGVASVPVAGSHIKLKK